MRVIHINFSDINGGAARAAYRIHHCLRASGVDSTLWVNKASAGDWTVESSSSKREKLSLVLRSKVAGLLRRTLKTGNLIIHSPAVFSSQWVKRINESDADVVNLHWVQGEMLSIDDIGRIEKPIVWTLHDMWAFCGAEHYTEDHRWRDGYTSNNRSNYESGFDLNRWVWGRKKKHWVKPMHIVAPSDWLADCARNSGLMCGWPVDRISYPIDINRWKPIDQKLARELLGLPKDVPLLLFGAMGGGRDPRKGFDLLVDALGHLEGKVEGLELVVFGELEPKLIPDLGFPIRYMGHLHDDVSLRLLYSAADVFALPSRQDNLPLTCMESLACGTPVVAFNSSGAPSMIEHKKTGFLADAFNSVDFARGVSYILRHPNQCFLRESVLKYAKLNFDPIIVAEKYLEIYSNVLDRNHVD